MFIFSPARKESIVFVITRVHSNNSNSAETSQRVSVYANLKRFHPKLLKAREKKKKFGNT